MVNWSLTWVEAERVVKVVEVEAELRPDCGTRYDELAAISENLEKGEP